jgi:hypothetical protein
MPSNKAANAAQMSAVAGEKVAYAVS